MIGILSEIIDDDIPGVNGKAPVKKKSVVISYIYKKNQGIVVGFTGELLRTLLSGFKTGDKVEIQYKEKVNKSKNGRAFNKLIATNIKRL